MPDHHLVGPFPAGANPTEYDHLRRRVFWTLPGGIYLLGSRAGERRNLMTTTWVTQLATEPKAVGVSVERAAYTHELIEAGRSFALSVLSREDRAVIRKFVKRAEPGPGPSELSGVAFRDAAVTGAPIVSVATAFIDCALERAIELGTHTLFIGEVVDAGFGEGPEDTPVLRIEDTRLNYGG